MRPFGWTLTIVAALGAMAGLGAFLEAAIHLVHDPSPNEEPKFLRYYGGWA